MGIAFLPSPIKQAVWNQDTLALLPSEDELEMEGEEKMWRWKKLLNRRYQLIFLLTQGKRFRVLCHLRRSPLVSGKVWSFP